MSKHDDKIKELIAKAEHQQSELGTRPKANWNTNGTFKYSSNEFFNLNTVKNSQQLVTALSFLLEKDYLHREAATRLNVAPKQFEWDGYPVSDWESDFKKRIEILQWQERKDQLEETKKKLHTLVSEEAKTAMELENIEKLLS